MASEPPLFGVRVVEFGSADDVASGTAVLSDWGADVIKVDLTDVSLPRRSAGIDDSRGKQTMSLHPEMAETKVALYALVASADVFATNISAAELEKLGLCPETLCDRHPSLIVAVATAYGRNGPDSRRTGDDVAAFWARSGLAMQMTPEGQAPRVPGHGVGSRITGMSLAGGICAALVRRARTGRGCIVETSLFHSGAYSNGGRLSIALHNDTNGVYPDPTMAGKNPLFQTYSLGDGSFIELLGLESQRHLPAISAALELPQLQADERFNTAGGRNQNRVECHALIQGRLREKSLGAWAPIFAKHDVWYEVHQPLADLPGDAQAVASGIFVKTPDGARTYATPLTFSDAAGQLPAAVRSASSSARADEVLQRSGLESDRSHSVAAAESKL